MSTLEWVLVVVLVTVPIVLIFFRRIRRRHTALLIIIWLVALIGWFFVSARLSVDCALQGFIGC